MRIYQQGTPIDVRMNVKKHLSLVENHKILHHIASIFATERQNVLAYAN